MIPARSSCSILRIAALAMAAVAVVAAAAPSIVVPAYASDQGAKPQRRHLLPANRYYTLQPFTMPLFDGERVVEQMTIVIALKMGSDDDARRKIERMVPIIRDVMYRELFRMVSFRHKGEPLPGVDMFKARLSRAIRVVASEKLIKSLAIQQAFERPAR